MMYDELCSWENLRLAHQKAARGKRKRQAAATFEYNLADKLLTLQEELRRQTYQPGPYFSFYITRCARRNRNNPNNRNNNNGFRLVVVSHIAADLPEMRSGYGWTAEALRDGPTASLAESGSNGTRPGEYKRGPAPWLIPEPDHLIFMFSMPQRWDAKSSGMTKLYFVGKAQLWTPFNVKRPALQAVLGGKPSDLPVKRIW